MAGEPRDVVRAFYEAVIKRDAEALSELITTSFREDAAVEWPAGLPYGGRIEGARTLRKVFAGLAAPQAVMGPENVELVSIIDGGQQLAAELAFDWRGNGATVATGALELWSFDAGLVTEIRAYYWDTAACQALLRPTPSA